MRARVAHLHRRGVRAQVEPAALLVLHVDVEGVLHRARRMVLRVVQCGEAHPVGLDLGAVGDVEAHRAEDRLDALDRAATPDAGRRRRRRRPGSVTSSASARSCASSSACASAWRALLQRALRCAALARLISAPRDFFSSTDSAASAFSSSVTRPALPRKRALAFSSSAGVGAACELAAAHERTSWSRSFMSVSIDRMKTGRPRR